MSPEKDLKAQKADGAVCPGTVFTILVGVWQGINGS